MILPRSLPGGFSTGSSIPPTTPEVDTMSSTTTNGNSLITFTKTILLPITIALLLYLLLFHALLPLYRTHRARYAQYLPLNSLPTSLQPATLRSSASSLFLRVFLPRTWAFHNENRHRSTRSGTRRPSIPSTISEEDLSDTSSADADNASDRFSDDHGEAMIGFSLYPSRTRNNNPTMNAADANRRRRDAMERQVSRGINAAREMNSSTPAAAYDEPAPERRLSRELEEVFRDDSDDDDEEERDRGVTVGRRSLSVSRR